MAPRTVNLAAEIIRNKSRVFEYSFSSGSKLLFQQLSTALEGIPRAPLLLIEGRWSCVQPYLLDHQTLLLPHIACWCWRWYCCCWSAARLIVDDEFLCCEWSAVRRAVGVDRVLTEAQGPAMNWRRRPNWPTLSPFSAWPAAVIVV